MSFEPVDVLRDLGLSDKEIEVYLALLELGSATATTVSDKSGVFRTYCYDILDSLEEKSLVSKVKKSATQHFEAVHPKRLHELLQEKEYKLEQIMPDLTSRLEQGEEMPEVQFFRGREGFKYVHEDILDSEPDEVLVLGPTANAYEMMEWYVPKYIKQRTEAGIHARVLTQGSQTPEEKSKAKDDEYRRETRFLPDDCFIPTLKYVYGDKVSIFSFDEMLSVLIRDPTTAQGERQTFNLIWELTE